MDFLYSTGNSAQYSIMPYTGKEYKMDWMDVQQKLISLKSTILQ